MEERQSTTGAISRKEKRFLELFKKISEADYIPGNTQENNKE